ncbi:MAG TPA: hypothetical protein VFS17_09420 [Methylophilaceae bacterium]|nr:hypothetical protein [Methylophilaceae bacterium]
MPAGANPKREREYKELEKRFKKEGRYPGREDEVAARIVNKQRAQYGETRDEQRKDRQGKSPDRNLSIDPYQKLTIAEIDKRLEGLSAVELRKTLSYEAEHKNRKGMLAKLDQRLSRH